MLEGQLPLEFLEGSRLVATCEADEPQQEVQSRCTETRALLLPILRERARHQLLFGLLEAPRAT